MGGFLAWAGAVAILATPAVAFLIWKGMRKDGASRGRAGGVAAFLALFYAMAMLALVGVGANMTETQKALDAGFADASEMKAAAAAGAKTQSEYQVLLDKQAREAEAQAAKQAELDKQAADAKAAAEAAEAAACSKDLKCEGDKLAMDAEGVCSRLIEKSAKWDYKWTNSWLESKFPYRRWHDKKHTAIEFVGDEIKLQNGFGAWSHQIYRCAVDVNTGVVVDLSVEQGRLQ